MKYLQLKENLKKEILPVYTVIGDDDYLISNTIKLIKKVSVDDISEINYDVFNDENYDINLVLNSIQQLAFISSKRMVVVYLPEKVKKDDLNILSEYCLHPNPDVVLVVVDKQNVFKNGEIIDCNKLTSQELLRIIPNFFKKYNKGITAEAANILIELCQNNTMLISKEVEKISFYCESDIVNKTDIEELIKLDIQFEVFKLINFIANKNKNEAIKHINALVESKEDIQGVISLISTTFRRMFYAKISPLPSQELADKLMVKQYAVTKAKENAAAFSPKQLKKILELCEEVDYLTKQSLLSPANALHYLVFNIFII